MCRARDSASQGLAREAAPAWRYSMASAAQNRELRQSSSDGLPNVPPLPTVAEALPRSSLRSLQSPCLQNITYLRHVPAYRPSIMGKLTSTIGIPIKLLNEAQVSNKSRTREVQADQIYCAGSCCYFRAHLRPGVPRKAARRYFFPRHPRLLHPPNLAYLDAHSSNTYTNSSSQPKTT